MRVPVLQFGAVYLAGLWFSGGVRIVTVLAVAVLLILLVVRASSWLRLLVVVGWVGAVTPLKGDRRLPESHEFIPSGVLAGALAVAEAFQHVRGGNAMIGRRDVGLSLWRPGEDPWSERAADGPLVDILPSMLWW